MTKNFLKIESKDYINNFYRHKLYNKEKDLYLITIDNGSFIFLNSSALKQLKKGKIESKEIYDKLEEKGIIITQKNISKIIKKTKEKYGFLNNGTTLHIVIPTHRCNLACTYCFASATPIDNSKEDDLDEKTAKKIIEFILNSPSSSITIEFQGGEATARFDLIQTMVKYAKELNKIKKKDLILTIVSNLTLMTEEKARWLIDNGVSICTSLDGPEYVHNKNRFILGKNGKEIGTFENVIFWIKKINEIYKEKNINRKVSALPTITKYSLPYYKEIIDLFLELKIDMVDLRPLTYVGRILEDEEKNPSFPINEFTKFYINSLNYLEEKKKQGKRIDERLKKIYEKKILENKPGYHTDFENPCGAATGQITYHSDGNIYTCNEALGREEFKIGNVFKDKWSDIFKRKETSKAILNSMLESNVKCDRCVFKPYCGTCMVENYYHFGKFNFYPTKTQKHHQTIMQSKLIFDKIIEKIK
jgi:His-Xaa-Ser system radical SAM maturase HxsB